MRWLCLAALLASGCGVAVSRASALPACGGPVSPDQLGAIHFLSDRVGVGLTVLPRRCGAMLAVSRDGGRHWRTEGTALAIDGPVEQMVATSPRDAWAAVEGGRLMSTTDGGATWTTESPRGSVLALAVSGRTVWMLGCLGAPDYDCAAVLLRKTLPDGVWTIASPKLTPNPPPDLVVARGRALISETRSLVTVTDRGRRFTTRPNPTWMGRPCFPAGLAAAGRNSWLLCLGGAAAGSSAKALLHTTDGGRTWTIASQVTSLTAPPQPGAITREEPDALVAASATRLWLAALNNLFVSSDGGARWSLVRGPNPQGDPTSFDVLSPTHAWLLAGGQGLWRTTDGRHWAALARPIQP